MSEPAAKGWLLAVSTSVSIAAVAAGVVNGALQWSSEARARRAETELRVAQEFLATMEYAHARKSTALSEKCVELLLPKLLASARDDVSDTARYSEALMQGCVVRMPVGQAAQEAEIELLADLALRHPFLAPAARQGLHSLLEQGISPEVTRRALERLEGHGTSR